MNTDLEMETTTIEIVTDKIEVMVVVTEEIVEVVVVTENFPANAITLVKQVTKRKTVGRKIRVRSEQVW